MKTTKIECWPSIDNRGLPRPKGKELLFSFIFAHFMPIALRERRDLTDLKVSDSRSGRRSNPGTHQRTKDEAPTERQ